MSDPAALSADIKLPAFKLDGKRIDARVADAVTAGSVETTIEAAPTLELTIRDSDRELLRSMLFRDRVQMIAVGEKWELAQLRKQGDDLVLVFEQYLVAVLRRAKGARKSKRGKVTRAEFVKSLLDEIKKPRFKLVCPELHVKQPIGKSKGRETRKSKDDRRAPGIAKGAKLYIRHSKTPATAEQLDLAERTFDVCESHDAPRVVFIAAAMAGINETGFSNPSGSSDGLSAGMLQLQFKYARGTDLMDPEAQVEHFLLKGSAIDMGALEYARKNPDASPAQICRDVWGGQGFPLSTWTRWADEAVALVEAYGGGGLGGGSRTRKKPFWFKRGRKESTWKATGRLAAEVGWRRFVVGDKFFFVAEEDLMRSRPRLTLSEDSPGVDNIDFDIDVGRDADEATVTCRAKLWQVPPGAVVVIERCGPQANGRWLVSSVRRDLFGLDTEISLRRGRALLDEKPEPANETVEVRRGGSGGGIGSDGDGMLNPVEGGSVSSNYGPRSSPGGIGSTNHDGIDIAVPEGTPIRAALSGKVTSAGPNGGYGNYVAIQHDGGLLTFYAHLSTIAVRVGQKVDRGEVVAKSGNTGTSTGPHLHFGVHRKGVSVNPAEYL
jgi:hypothetical protein